MNSNDWKNLNFGFTLTGVRNVLIKRVLSPYRKYNDLLHRSQYWPAERLVEYQWARLQSVIQRAFRAVPYYRGLMAVYGIDPKAIHSFSDVQMIPLLEKEQVRRNPRDLIAEDMISPILYKCHTSGTTGKPLTLYRDLHNVGFEHALLTRQRLWAGLCPNSRIATLKGEMPQSTRTQKGRYWHYSWAENKLVMSSYHLSEGTALAYIKALQRFGPEGMDGYPSSIFLLARFFLSRNQILPLKAVLTSSETLTSEQRATIEQAFQCRVFDYYGMAERVAAVHTCEKGSYHLVPEYSYVEFLRNSRLPDDQYEIIGTSFTNRAMPLIRYRIGDVIKPGHQTCSCGRHYPVIEGILGRTDDYIVTPSGKLIGRLDHIFKGAQNLIEAQIYQPDSRHLILRIVPDKSFQKGDADKILQNLQWRVGEPMEFEVESLKAIPRNGRGKFKAVVSDVKYWLN